MSDVVLVHGVFHGGWCWDEVATRLRAAGHRVVAPTLTGLAERRDLLSADVDIETHLRDVLEAITAEGMEDVVLVCHSYGGMPGVGATDRAPGRISALVLLDAMLPVDALSSNDLRDRSSPAWSMEQGDGISIPPPSSAVFGIPPSDRPRIDALLTPHPAATLTTPLRLTGAYRTIATRRFYRATGYVAPYFDETAQRAAQEGGWVVDHHDLVHDMMLTDPA